MPSAEWLNNRLEEGRTGGTSTCPDIQHPAVCKYYTSGIYVWRIILSFIVLKAYLSNLLQLLLLLANWDSSFVSISTGFVCSIHFSKLISCCVLLKSTVAPAHPGSEFISSTAAQLLLEKHDCNPASLDVAAHTDTYRTSDMTPVIISLNSSSFLLSEHLLTHSPTEHTPNQSGRWTMDTRKVVIIPVNDKFLSEHAAVNCLGLDFIKHWWSVDYITASTTFNPHSIHLLLSSIMTVFSGESCFLAHWVRLTFNCYG